MLAAVAEFPNEAEGLVRAAEFRRENGGEWRWRRALNRPSHQCCQPHVGHNIPMPPAATSEHAEDSNVVTHLIRQALGAKVPRVVDTRKHPERYNGGVGALMRDFHAITPAGGDKRY